MIYSEYPLPNYPKTSFDQCLFQVIKAGTSVNEKDSIVVTQSSVSLVHIYQNVLNWNENRVCLELLPLDPVIQIQSAIQDIDKAIIIMCRLKLQRILSTMNQRYESFGFPVFLNFDADKVDKSDYAPDYTSFAMHLVHLARLGNCPILMIRISMSLLLCHYFDYALSLIACLYDVLKHTENGNELVSNVINYTFDNISDKHLFIFQLYKSKFKLEDLAIKKRQFPWYNKLCLLFTWSTSVSLHKHKLITLAVVLAYQSKLYLKSIEYVQEYFSYKTEDSNPLNSTSTSLDTYALNTPVFLLFKMACAYDYLNKQSEASCIAVQLLTLVDFPAMQTRLFQIILSSGTTTKAQVPIINEQEYQSYTTNPIHTLIKLTLLYSELLHHDDFNVYFTKYIRKNDLNVITRVKKVKLNKTKFYIKDNQHFTAGLINVAVLVVFQSLIVIDFDSISISINNQVISVKNVHLQGPCKQTLIFNGTLETTGSFKVDCVVCKFGNTEIFFDCTPATLVINRPTVPSPVKLHFHDIPTNELFEYTTDAVKKDSNILNVLHDKDLVDVSATLSDDKIIISFIPVSSKSHFIEIVHGTDYEANLLRHTFTSVDALQIKVDFQFNGNGLFLLNILNKSMHDIDVKTEAQLIENSLIYSKQSSIIPCLYDEIPSVIKVYYKSCMNTTSWLHVDIPVLINNQIYSFIECPGVIHPGVIFEIKYWLFNMMSMSSGVIDFSFNDSQIVLASGCRNFQDEIKEKKLKCYKYMAMVEETGKYSIPLITLKIEFEAVEIVCVEKVAKSSNKLIDF
eukprot:NODE_5_length_49639_cov_0.484336.p5 type:complete len:794 gc:universal NODE_5_length_49639_cov_0.484336:8503-6122(-)